MPTPGAAEDPLFDKQTREQLEFLSRDRWYHSLELADGRVIEGLIPLEALRARMDSYPIPKDLRGKRVLDVGAATGWCSFELERRGAEVVATDCVEFQEFRQAHELLGSKVDYRILDVEELSPETVGVFDYVLFFGVLYHCRHPLLALERVCTLTKEAAFIESFVADSHAPAEEERAGPCVMEFYEAAELGGQIDNWYGPSRNCLLALCRSAGFARADLEHLIDRRAGVTCYRRWEPAAKKPTQPAPWINAATNNRTNDVYFHKGKDEYICLYFKTPQRPLTKDQMRVEIGGMGVPTLLLTDLEAQGSGRHGWQASLRVPPWLQPGEHQARLRTTDSPFSNAVELIVLAPGEQPPTSTRQRPVPLDQATAAPPEIFEVGNTMKKTRLFRGYRQEYLNCYFRTPESGLTKDDIIVEVEGADSPVMSLTDLGNGEWQANSKLPANLKPGSHPVRLRTSSSPYSNEVEISLEPDDG